MKKIKFIYDTVTDNFPMMNGFPEIRSSLYQDLNDSIFEKSFESIDSVQSLRDDTLYIYPIELLRFHFSEVFKKLNEKSIQKIQQLKITILVYFPTEGFESSHRGGQFWLDKIQYQFEQFRLHSNPKFLIFGNLLMENSYNKYILNDIRSIKVTFESGKEYTISSYHDSLVPNFLKRISDIRFNRVYGINYFENKHRENIEIRWTKEYFKNKEYISFDEMRDSNKIKNFLSYNGNFRAGRLALVSEILRRELQHNSYLSFIGGRDIKLENVVADSKSMLSYDGRIYVDDYVKTWTPIEIDIDGEKKQTDILVSEKRHYLDTYFSMVSETETDPGIIFLTEKTFKPIVCYHPFILWGSPGILATLKSWGYETFPEMFSEEYDKIEDSRLRLTLILDQVEQFNKLDKAEKDKKFLSVLEKLEHNRNLFFSRRHEFRENINKIFEDIEINSRLNL